MTAHECFVSQIESHIRFLEGIGGEIQCWKVWPVATEQQIKEAEEQLGFGIPSSLRNVFQSVAASVDFD